VLAASVLAALVVAFALSTRGGDGDGGETWRRGLLAGEQLRLLPGNRYRIEYWTRLGAGDVVESGTWSRLGDTVSLVPAAPGKSAYLMLQSVSGDERLLVRAGEEAFERVD